MNDRFAGRNQHMVFDTGELSEASVKVLFKKFEKVVQDFDELADLDISMPEQKKKAYAMLIAFRPWAYWAILEKTAQDMPLNAARSQAR